MLIWTKDINGNDVIEDNGVIEVPKSITPRQIRLVLYNLGLLDTVISMTTQDVVMGIWWEYSLEVERYNEFIVSAGTTLNLTEEAIDNIFIEGAKL